MLGVERRDRVVQQQPAGAQQREQRARVQVDLALADVLGHADARDRIERAAAAAGGSPRRGSRRGPPGPPRHPLARELGLRPVRSSRRSPSRRSSRAAWIAKLPQPQPTSSTRIPGCERRACSRPDRASSRCASSSVSRAAREDRAAVGHRLVEEQREEVVADVVVVADGRRVALDAVQLRRAGSARGSDAAESRRERSRGKDRQPEAHAIGGAESAAAPSRRPPTNAASRSSTASEPSTYARPRPSVPGARRKCASAEGRRTKNVGASGAVAARRRRPRSARGTAARAARAPALCTTARSRGSMPRP